MSILYIDNTQLSAVNTCELKAGLRYVLGLTTAEERLELSAGTAVHTALEVWHKGESREVALSKFDHYYKPLGSKVSVEDRLSFTNVRRVIARFFAHFTQYPLPYTVQKDLVEVTFEAPLDEHGDIVMVGRLDSIATYQQRLVVLENKTTGSLSGFWKDKWPMASQLTTYVYGAQHGLVSGKPLNLPVEEALVLGIELRKLPTSTAKCKEHGLPYAECGDFHAKWELSGPHPRPEPFIERWRTNALGAAKRFGWMQENLHTVQDCADKLEAQGQFNGSCVWCEFKDYCRQGVPVAVMEANLVKQVWNPRNVKHDTLIMPLPVAAEPAIPDRGVLVGAAPLPSNARPT